MSMPINLSQPQTGFALLELISVAQTRTRDARLRGELSTATPLERLIGMDCSYGKLLLEAIWKK
jgi:hypothetical protein